jgi:hypothetical protein
MRAAICVLAIGVGLPASLAAQPVVEAVAPPTKLETLLALDGVVVIRGSSRVGAVRGEPGFLVTVANKEFTNASTGDRAHGITVEVKKVDRRDPDRTSYVDFEEVPSLLTGLEYMAKLDKSATSLDRFEADYRTKGGLLVTVYTTNDVMKAAVTSGLGGTATVDLEFGEFQQFRQLLQSAYDSLKVIRGTEK